MMSSFYDEVLRASQTLDAMASEARRIVEAQEKMLEMTRTIDAAFATTETLRTMEGLTLGYKVLEAVDDIYRTAQAASAVTAAQSYLEQLANHLTLQEQAQKEAHDRAVALLLTGDTKSQVELWKLYDTLRLYTYNYDRLIGNISVENDSPRYVVDGQHRRLAYAELTLSSRETERIFDTLRRAFFARQWASEHALAEIFEVLKTEVGKTATLSGFFLPFVDIFDIPSTHDWVHGFMLWTGISPPVLVTVTYASLT